MDEQKIKKQIVEKFKKRTGFVKVVGSIEKVLDEIFPDIKDHLKENE